MQGFSTNLPLQLTSFIGRQRELREVKRLLAETRLLTLTGPGGSGKTRLALQVAADLRQQFADGVWLVELASLSVPALVPPTVASALGVYEQTARAPTDTLRDFLVSRTLLLVLDNCEHLAEACAQLTEALLRVCPHLQILTTSREALGVPGEVVWNVPPLSVPDLSHKSDSGSAVLLQYEAVRLFVERAAAVLPSFRLTDQNATTVAQICYRLDGLPLAIELAAARVKALSVEQIEARLSDRFHLLITGSRTAPLRQQTLYATLDWSYALLSEIEQRLMRRLSVFAGGWTLEAAEAVCAGQDVRSDQVLNALSGLVNRSLVLMQEENGAARYYFLETIRQFALERLVESNEYRQLRLGHSDFFLRLAEEARPLLFGANQALWFARLDAEHGNLRAAIDSSLEMNDAATALRWVEALWFFWFIRDRYQEGQERLSKVLAEPGAASPTSARAQALNAAGFISWAQGDFAHARVLFEEAQRIGNELGDNMAIATSWRNLGLVAYRERDHATARVLLEKSVALWRELGDKPAAGWTLPFLADLALFQGDSKRAQTLYEESVALLRELGDKIILAYQLRRLGFIALQSGDYAKALALGQESLALNRQVGDKRGVVACLAALAAVAVARDQMVEAVGLFASVQAQLDAIGIKFYLADRMEYERNLTAARRALDLKAFTEAWAQGWARTLDQAIESSAGMSLPPSPTRVAPRWDKQKFGGLTERERQVAALIAHGKSNRAIGKQLVITERTVEKHVENIMSKLGFGSRTQIATWAVEKGLTQTAD